MQIEWDKRAINQLQLEDGSTLADLVAMEVGGLGENMALRRGVFFKGKQAHARIGHYVHATGNSSD